MRLILVRHGETDWNREHRLQGQHDIPLNELGKTHARLIAQALRDESVEAIYTSPLSRALATAEAIIRFHHGVAIRTIDGLKEINVGKLDGMYASDVGSKYPEFFQMWITEAASVRMPGGESLPELQERVWQSVQGILDNNHANSVVVVSHFFAILSIVCKVLNLNLSEFRRLSVTIGSITVMDFGEGKVKLASFNDTCHLR